MNISKFAMYTAMGLIVYSGAAHASDSWFVRSHLGAGQVSDQSASTSNFGGGVNSLASKIDSGFAAGIGVGYQFSKRWAAELGWEYRSNDAKVTLDNGQVFADGNYASNVFYLNGIYSLAPAGKWQPYLGLGATWVQEIDMDLQEGNVERSFSDSGFTGYQVFAGLSRPLSKKWALEGEIRYGSISRIDLSEESGSGQLVDLDYDPMTIQIGLKYRF